MTSPASIPMNDFARQWSDTSADVLAAVAQVGASGWYILGKQVATFEQALASFSGCSHAIGCANGLDAIEIGLRALGLQPGQRVLTTPLSAFATTLAIVRAGGVPVFVDTDASGLLDLDLVERELVRDPYLRFLVPVHLYGHTLALGRLQTLKERFGLKLVEDMAQAIGARSGLHSVGSVGDISATSFYPTKNLGALGDGGAVLTGDPALAEACQTLRDYGQSAKYVHSVLGLNSRLDELHAAILAGAFLPRLPAWTQRRCEIAERYRADIRHPLVTPLPVPAESGSVWHLFPTLVSGAGRVALAAHLKRHGIGSAVHYPHLIPAQPALAGSVFEIRGELVCAQRLADGELSLPIHPYLTDGEVAHVIATVNGWPGTGS